MKSIKHPKYYGGSDNPYETIKVIEALKLDFHLGNTYKYISRAGLKVKKKKAILKAKIQCLKKTIWYLDRKIEQLQSKLSKAKCR